MNIPIGVVETTLALCFAGISTGFYFWIRHILKLIDDNKYSDVRERASLKKELKELRTELHTRMNNSEDKIADAIKELTSGVVPISHCNGRQEVWTGRFENLINTIKVESEAKNKTDVIMHTALNDTLIQVAADVKQLSECVTKLSNKKECD